MEKPAAPTQNAVELRGNYAGAAADYTLPQAYADYTAADQVTWARLYHRQYALLRTHAAPEVLAGVEALRCSPDRIPRLEEVSDLLLRQTGWQLVGVPGLIPESVFFAHLAARRFPVTTWLRKPEELDYLVEPDLFHDFFGHVPLLTNPVFATFLQAYGARGPEAEAHGGLKMLARLYWYMVEFGLIRTSGGLRAYGAGMLSSAAETRYCLESPVPERLAFNLERVLRTDYLIDDFQKNYFVIGSYAQLIEAVLGTDFVPLYRRWATTPGIVPGTVLPTDTRVPLRPS